MTFRSSWEIVKVLGMRLIFVLAMALLAVAGIGTFC